MPPVRTRPALATIAACLACHAEPPAASSSTSASADDAATTEPSSSSTASTESSADTTTDSDPQAPEHGLHESGTRLRARVLDGGEGATLFRGWWDTELEIDCQIAIAPDGRPRCLPPPQPIQFLDDACTQPVIAPPDPDALVPAFSAEIVSTCDRLPRLHVFTIGAPMTVDATYQRSLGLCGPAPDNGATQVFVAEPVTEATFATGELVVETHAGVEVEVFVGDDGARFVTNARDPSTLRGCAMSPVADDERDADGVCLAADAAYPSTSIDASCQVEVAYTCRSIDCPDPSIVVASTEACSSAFEVLAIAAPLDPEVCVPPVDTPVCPYFEVGDAIDPSTFPALRLVPRGSGRLRIHDVVADDGQAIAAHVQPVWDEELARHCGLRGEYEWLADGERVCLTDVATTWVGFADPECTRPVVGVTDGGCGESLPTYAESDSDPWDNIVGTFPSHLYAIEGPLTGDVVYTPDDCTPANFTGSLFVVGDEITAADAPPILVERIE